MPPKNEDEILQSINIFTKGGCLESELKEDYLVLKIDEKDYLVTVSIDGGYAGEIDVSFGESPINSYREKVLENRV